MCYEYLVRAIGGSSLDSLESSAERLQRALNGGEVDAYVELGWELWKIEILNSDEATGINGMLLVYRRPKE